MQAGLLKEWITIQQEITERSPSGSVKREWRDLYHKKARVQFKGGDAVVSNWETTHTINILVTIRYQKGIDRNMRIIWNNEKYRILSADRDRMQMSLMLKCELINE